jgi:hypothetical protein
MYTENTCDLKTGLELGDQVTKINGKSVEDYINTLSSYQYASSVTTKRERSLSAITSRSYAIYDSSNISFTVMRSGQELTFQESFFFYDYDLLATDKTALLSNDYKICNYTNSTKRDYKGFYYSLPLYKEKWSFSSEPNYRGIDAYFSNVTNNNGSNACYFKLNNFNSLTGRFSDEPQGTQSKQLWRRLKDELDICNKNGDTLIIDLQSNEGGEYYELGEFISLITPSNIDPLNMFRNVRLKHDLMGQYLCEGEVFFQDFDAVMGDSFNGAFCRDLESSNSWQSQGYDNKIIVLTSSNCMSSCDIAAASLKMLPNVTVIGKPTHGAFNGISNYGSFGSTTTGPVTLFNTDISTFVVNNVINSPNTDDVCGSYYRCYTPLEGKPVVPHIDYNITVKDIIGLPIGTDLRNKISSLLDVKTLAVSE